MKFTKVFACMALAGLAGNAYATNGMNLEGYGPIAAGMGGASMAYDNGNAAVMNNPATLGLMEQGSRFDLAVGKLGPDITSTAGPYVAPSGGDAYYMPAIGWTKKSGATTYGVALFAQGGMGTEYDGSTFMSAGSGLPTRSELGVGRLIAPLAYEVSPKLSVGGSVDLVWAMMDLQMAMTGAQFADMVPGLGGTETYGTASGSMVTGLTGALTNSVITNVDWAYFNFSDDSDFTGKAKATGLAGKLGFAYKVTPQLTIGGTYHSKTNLGDMEGDAVLSMQVDTGANAASMGLPVDTANVVLPITGKISVVNFQWPETYGIGMAYQATDRLMVAADYKRINWQDVMKDFKMTFNADNIVENGAFAGASLDATMFQNWEDQDVFMIGMAYKATDAVTLRLGANLANNPVPDTYMNPLFPAIVKKHYTIGAGYAFSKASEVNFSLQHAPEVSQTNGQGVTVDHSQTNWQLMYSRKF